MQSDLSAALAEWCLECEVAFRSRPILKRSPRMKRQALELILRRHPAWSDRKIAEVLLVNREFVAAARARLVKSGAIARPETRLGRDGKRYAMVGA